MAAPAKAPAKRKRASDGREAEAAPSRRPQARAARASHAPAPAAPAPRAAKRRQSEAEPARVPQAKRARAAKVEDRGLEALPPVAHASHLKARERCDCGCWGGDGVLRHNRYIYPAVSAVVALTVRLLQLKPARLHCVLQSAEFVSSSLV